MPPLRETHLTRLKLGEGSGSSDVRELRELMAALIGMVQQQAEASQRQEEASRRREEVASRRVEEASRRPEEETSRRLEGALQCQEEVSRRQAEQIERQQDMLARQVEAMQMAHEHMATPQVGATTEGVAMAARPAPFVGVCREVPQWADSEAGEAEYAALKAEQDQAMEALASFQKFHPPTFSGGKIDPMVVSKSAPM